ncbi:PH domain-containing protein [Demequina sp. SYSU T00039]|uniref:PH domain-containing protein n=1 Tax=Demequina lignilytica TaxID=3051663 RepID=A0AAW7M236_9MICO|nr:MULTISPECIES: PH domain-containing protein [unclassified Demequina]MDN4478898.1 PH domain-containing protein [Demequina sp. SYSU T00039-1]MDN4488773.1 PH domain-containing protein [Demequina sp. SYSU T00039]MDN4491843.1 PH domain-containing protein [Demequina sp. SYSU T00068]
MALLLYPVATAAALVGAHESAGDGDMSDALVFGLAAMFLVVWGSAMGFRARVVLEGDELVVRNVFVSHRCAAGAVRAVRSQGEARLVIELVDGRELKCWAIQATNLMLMLGRATRVDKVAGELRTALADVSPVDGPVVVAREWTGASWHAVALIALYGWAIVRAFGI